MTLREAGSKPGSLDRSEISLFLLREDVGECYAALVRSAAAAVGAEACHLALYDARSDELIAQRPSYNAPVGPVPRFRFPLETAPASAFVVRNGRPYCSNDPAHDPFYDSSASTRGLESVLTVPVRRGEEVVGLLYALNKPGGFAAEDIATLGSLADAVAVSLENIRLYEELAAAKAQIADYARRLERRVQATHEKYRVLMEEASDAIFVLDLAGRILETNRRAEEIVLRPRIRILGRPYSDFLPAAERAPAEGRLERLRVEGISRSTGPVAILRSDGTLVRVDFSSSVVDLGNERVILAIAREVPDRPAASAESAESAPAPPRRAKPRGRRNGAGGGA